MRNRFTSPIGAEYKKGACENLKRPSEKLAIPSVRFTCRAWLGEPNSYAVTASAAVVDSEPELVALLFC
jgi:hypothetical protein